MNNVEKTSEVETVRPLARVLARELSQEELQAVSGGWNPPGSTRCGLNPNHHGDTDDHY